MSSSLLLFPQRFGWYVLRPSSGVAEIIIKMKTTVRKPLMIKNHQASSQKFRQLFDYGFRWLKIFYSDVNIIIYWQIREEIASFSVSILSVWHMSFLLGYCHTHTHTHTHTCICIYIHTSIDIFIHTRTHIYICIYIFIYTNIHTLINIQISICRVWCISSHHFEIVILCIHIFFKFLSIVQQTRVSWTLSFRKTGPWCNFSKNLEMANRTTWHSHQVLQYKDITEFECLSEDIFIFMKSKIPSQDHVVWGGH